RPRAEGADRALPHPARLARRVELHHHTHSRTKLSVLFISKPLHPARTPISSSKWRRNCSAGGSCSASTCPARFGRRCFPVPVPAFLSPTRLVGHRLLNPRGQEGQ